MKNQLQDILYFKFPGANAPGARGWEVLYTAKGDMELNWNEETMLRGKPSKEELLKWDSELEKEKENGNA